MSAQEKFLEELRERIKKVLELREEKKRRMNQLYKENPDDFEVRSSSELKDLMSKCKGFLDLTIKGVEELRDHSSERHGNHSGDVSIIIVLVF